MERAMRFIRIIILSLLIVGVVLLLFFRLGGLLCTLIVSAVFAYLLNKPLAAMERKIRRQWALLIIFGLLAGIAAVLSVYIVPMLFRQAAYLVSYVPKVIESAVKMLDNAGSMAGEPLASMARQAFDGFNKRAVEWLGNSTISLAQGFSAGIGWALLSPVFTFYFLKDHEYFVDQIGYLIPLRYRSDLHMLYLSIDKAVGQFLRGQLLVSLGVAVMTTAGLLIIGVPVAPLLGLICGLCNMIPYIGPLIGAIPVALVSASMGWQTVLISVIVILVVQQLDNMIISPKIIGDSLRIHPIYIIIAIIAGSGLFGVMGLLLALPMLIVLKEIILFFFRKRIRRYNENGDDIDIESRSEKN